MLLISHFSPLGFFHFSRPVAFIAVSSFTRLIHFVLFHFFRCSGSYLLSAIFCHCLLLFNYIKSHCYCLAPAVWGALRISFSYSQSFVCIYICHISLIQFSISSYHLFFISHLCSYSIFYTLYRKYILRFLP